NGVQSVLALSSRNCVTLFADLVDGGIHLRPGCDGARGETDEILHRRLVVEGEEDLADRGRVRSAAPAHFRYAADTLGAHREVEHHDVAATEHAQSRSLSGGVAQLRQVGVHQVAEIPTVPGRMR